ncbi:MAG: FAD-dependent oxidoreductase [Clostridiales bacterium]|nr:FAD-dependent oxidoreductase [Clostridiales bacterium]
MHDIIVIGAGTAGMTAALYALRNGKSVLLLEGECVGGQIANSPRVENFPSVKAISGSEFSDRLFEQIKALGAELELERAEQIQKNADVFTVKTDSGAHEARAVIIATGVKHKKIGVDREEELTGSGVSYCAVCDGPFYSGDDVALVGDANTALQYGILLSGYCNKVYVCTWMDKFFGDKALVDTLLQKPNVEWVKNVTLCGLEGSDELSACVFDEKDTGKKRSIPVKACFIAIGQEPDNAPFNDVVKLDGKGYIAADESCMTDTAGVFVAGDCRTKKVRQLTTAVADGASAAMAACKYLG